MGRLSRLLGHPWTVRGSQIAIGLIFVWAGLAKVGDPRSFAGQVHNFRVLPVALENLVAIILPWVELVTGLALVTRIRARAGAVIATALMVLFTLSIGIAVARGLDIECGCFGTADGSRVGAQKLLENLGMLVLALAGSQRGTD